MWGKDPVLRSMGRRSALLRFFIAGILCVAGIGTLCAAPKKETKQYATVQEAARNGDLDQLRAMLERSPAELRSRNSAGQTPLHVAVADAKDRAMVEFLLSQGADVDAKDENGSTPLHLAASLDLSALAGVLLDHGARVDAVRRDGDTPLLAAARRQRSEVARVLLARGADSARTDPLGFTPLHLAAGGSEDLVRQLIAHGAATGARTRDGRTPLYIAYSRRDAGPDGRKIVELLLAGGAKLDQAVDESEDTLLHRVPFIMPAEKQAASIDELIALGAKTDLRNGVGRTPLQVAVRAGQLESVKALLAHGANPNVFDRDWMTPLFDAVDTNRIEFAKILLAAGANPNLKGDPRDATHTPLTLASFRGRLEMVELLLAGGAEVNLPAAHRSALGWARRANQHPVIYLLTAKGAVD